VDRQRLGLKSAFCAPVACTSYRCLWRSLPRYRSPGGNASPDYTDPKQLRRN